MYVDVRIYIDDVSNDSNTRHLIFVFSFLHGSFSNQDRSESFVGYVRVSFQRNATSSGSSEARKLFFFSSKRPCSLGWFVGGFVWWEDTRQMEHMTFQRYIRVNQLPSSSS